MCTRDATELREVSTVDLRRRAFQVAGLQESTVAPRPWNVDEAIQRKRKEGMPKEPTSVEEPLDLAWLARSCPNLQVLLDRAGPNSSRILAFSTGFHLQACADAGTWFLDGTFKVIILVL